MPTPTKGARFGGSPAHERIILANLASQLFEHGRIVTTEAKAKRLRPLAEKLITKAKRADLHARRQVLTTVRDRGVVHRLFTEIAPAFAEREGGYTRITKVGPRKGDNAPMAVIELVEETVEESKKANAKGSTSDRSPAKKSAARPAAGSTVAPVTVPSATDTPAAGSAAAVAVPSATDTPAGEPAGEEGPDSGSQVEPTEEPTPAEELVGEKAAADSDTDVNEASDDVAAEETEGQDKNDTA